MHGNLPSKSCSLKVYKSAWHKAFQINNNFKVTVTNSTINGSLAAQAYKTIIKFWIRSKINEKWKYKSSQNSQIINKIHFVNT